VVAKVLGDGNGLKVRETTRDGWQGAQSPSSGAVTDHWQRAGSGLTGVKAPFPLPGRNCSTLPICSGRAGCKSYSWAGVVVDQTRESAGPRDRRALVQRKRLRLRAKRACDDAHLSPGFRTSPFLIHSSFPWRCSPTSNHCCSHIRLFDCSDRPVLIDVDASLGIIIMSQVRALLDSHD